MIETRYEVLPLHLGTQIIDKGSLTLRKDVGKKIEAPFLAYLIQGASEVILVDSGPGLDLTRAEEHHNPIVSEGSHDLRTSLDRYGASVEDITLVINTHLHWDHCYGNELLPNARYLVQRTELAYATAPLPSDAPIYETNLGTAPFLRWHDRIDLVDGDAEIRPGLNVITLPGHTPGLQGVVISGADHDIVIASDHAPLFENWENAIPAGIYVDLEAWYRSDKRLRGLRNPVVLPGHDMRVLDCERYA